MDRRKLNYIEEKIQLLKKITPDSAFGEANNLISKFYQNNSPITSQ